MKHIFGLLFLCIYISVNAQISYTANDQVNPYTGVFRQGINFDYYPPYQDIDLANIAAGNPFLGLSGIGATTSRPALFESFVEAWGYDSRVFTFQHMKNLGMTDMTCIVGFPSEAHRDHTVYCSDGITESALFANLYTPIWDGGANGTPYNDNNYYAAYLYKVVSLYKDHVKFWEIWNEPGFDLTWNTGWRPAGDPAGNWWDQNPDPCDYVLHAPIEHFVRTMRISYEVIKTVDPDAYVALAGVGFESFLDAILRNTDNPLDGTVTDDYPLTGGAYFDVMGFHTYPDIDGSLGHFDANLNDWVRYRHSDAAAKGMTDRKASYQNLLASYGYDGVTYPKKEWIVTEQNVPRVPFSATTMASEESQVNYIMKVVVDAMQDDIRQIHPYQLADRRTVDQAYGEYDLMGLYLNFTGTTPYDSLHKTMEGIAYKTTSDALFGTGYDSVKTAEMNLPDSLGGGAFIDPINNRYVYALWAKTTIDMSEEATGVYHFPASFGYDSLLVRRWDNSETLDDQRIPATEIQLTGRPIFLFDGEDVDFGLLTLQCPDSMEVTIPGGDTVVEVNWADATATTTCPSDSATQVVLTSDLPSGSTFSVGPHIVSYEATDSCGNDQICSFQVVVTPEDPSSIDITCPDDLVVVAPVGEDRAIVVWDEATATTTCLSDEITIKQVGGQYSGATFVIGGHTIGYRATNLCGDTTTCSFLVTVQAAAGSCPPSILAFTKVGELNGHGYYLSQNQMTWDEAQSLATSSGGYIVSINSQTENDFVQSKINQATFIGLNDAANEGDVVWDNGDELVFTDYNTICSWCNENTDTFDYAAMVPWDGSWIFESQWTDRVFMMEMNCGDPGEITLSCPNDINITTAVGEEQAFWDTPVPTTSCTVNDNIELTLLSGMPSGSAFSLGTHTITYQASDACDNIVSCNFDVTVLAGTAECDSISGYTKLGTWNGHGYYLSDGLATWEEASVLADDAGGYLATMNDSTENEFLKSVLGQNMVFIGYSDAADEGQPTWIHGDNSSIDFSYNNSDTHDYAVMNFWAGTWEMVNFQVRKKYIVEIDCGNTVVPGCGVKSGFAKLGEFNGSGYYLSNQQNTWEQAKVIAANNGGYLATMNTQEENEFVRSNLDFDMPFIGLNDAANEGDLVWDNGEPLDLDLSFNNSDSTDYAVMNFWAGTWEMVQPAVRKKFLMEVGCSATTSSVSSHSLYLTLTHNRFVAQLTWQTSDNSTTNFYIIERSTDGHSFLPIGQLKSDKVKRLMSTYAFTDNEPLAGENVYRIVAVSLSGKKKVSNTTRAHFTQREDITLYPNPADRYVELDLLPYKGENVTVRITNQFGEIIKKLRLTQVTAAPVVVSLDGFRNGYYQVQLATDSGRSQTLQLIVAKGY